MKLSNQITVFLILLTGLSSSSVFSQSLEKTSKRLEIIRQQIREYELKISENETTEKVSLEVINEFERQIKLLDALMNTMTDQLSTIQLDIERTKINMAMTEKEMKDIKNHYAKYVSSVYKKGKSYDLELIFSSEDVNQFLVRMEYMKFFSDQRKRDLYNIIQKQKEINEQRLSLSEKYERQKSIINQKQKEETLIATRTEQKKRVLDKAQKNKKAFAEMLEQQRKEEERLQGTIAKLIEEDEIRRAKEAESGMKSFSKSTDYAKTSSVDFSALNSNYKLNKGKYPWPVENGVVISEYGKIYNKELKTTKINPGIDIAVPEGTDVRVILDGVVSIIDFNPEHGQIIIIRHSDKFITVYARFSEIYVKVGDEVKAGSIIGRSGGVNSSKGASIHFELWESKEPKDPQIWLAKND